MTNEQLERFIIDNKEAFGPTKPASNIWDKIEKRQPKKKTSSINWKLTLSRAAAVVAIFITSYYFHAYQSEQQAGGQDVTMSVFGENEQIYNELMEAESYYVSQIGDKKKELFSLTEDSPSLQKDINNDLTELDAILLELKADLKDNAANQEVIEAMMQNYILKLEILEDMLNQIKPTNEQDNKDEITYSI